MFANLGCHIHQFPSGRWGFVGTLPTVLASAVPASTADVMGGRACRGDAGEILTWKFPTFATEFEAREFAASRDVATVN